MALCRYAHPVMYDYPARLMNLVQHIPTVTVQNRLMAASDRDIALSLMYIESERRQRILSLLSARKRERVVDELRLQERLRITSDHYERAIRNVISALAQDRNQSSIRSYLRPRRSRNRA